MKKYRIIEERIPMLWGFVEGVTDEPPKDVLFSEPLLLLQERKSAFHKWKTIKEIDSVLEAEYFIYNQKVQKLKPVIKTIKTL